MLLSDFLSRHKHDTPEIIPLSFNMQEVLHARDNNIHETEQDRYFVQTRFQVKTSGTVLPKVHTIDKGVYPYLKPVIQVVKATKCTKNMFQLNQNIKFMLNQQEARQGRNKGKYTSMISYTTATRKG